MMAVSEAHMEVLSEVAWEDMEAVSVDPQHHHLLVLVQDHSQVVLLHLAPEVSEVSVCQDSDLVMLEE